MFRSMPRCVVPGAPQELVQRPLQRQTSRLISTQQHALPIISQQKPSLRLRPDVSLRQVRLSSQFAKSRSTIERMRDNLQDGWRRRWESPYQYGFSIAFITTLLGLIGYVVYDRVTRIEPGLSKYPREVADPLRRAVYFVEIDKQPVKALLLFKDALQVADKIGMHPFSDEVLGIRLKAVDVLEQNELTNAAIEMLERIEQDCSQWVQAGRVEEETGKKPEVKAPASPAPPKTEKEDKKGDSDAQAEEQEDPYANEPWRKEFVDESELRERVVKKTVGMKLKLAELQMRDDVRDLVKAERLLASATEQSLKELKRRREKHLPITSSRRDRDLYINLKEIASTMNDLADFYAGKRKHDFAALLYMQALALLKEDEGRGISCAQVVLLNNVASQMAEQAQLMQPGMTVIPPVEGPQISREQALRAAEQWAKKSLQVAAHVAPEVKTDQCDHTCLTATYNLGEIAEMQGDLSTARSYYTSAKSMAEKLQSEEGVLNAEVALKRLGPAS